MEKNLKKLEHFFKTDAMIKKDLIINAPPSMDDAYNAESLIKYSNKLEDEIKYIFFQIKNVIKNFYDDSDILNFIDEMKTNIIENLAHSCRNLTMLQKFYNDYLTDMSEELIDEVRESFIGYSIFSDIPIEVLKKVKTLNELLHVIHTAIVNNENIYQSINIIGKRDIINPLSGGYVEKYPLTLYGEEGKLSKEIFDIFPTDNFFCGNTDIVSLEKSCNKIIMMIRDRGHALMIELEIGDKDVKVDYHIPKLCNIEMINSLPGIRKVKADSLPFSGTTGMYVVSKDKLASSVIDLISRVPTDMDSIHIDYNTGHIQH